MTAKKTRRGIMSACEYSILTMQAIKKGLIEANPEQQEIAWAIGGIIITLASNLLRICQEIIAREKDGNNAIDDIKEIQRQFNEFVDRMVGHE